MRLAQAASEHEQIAWAAARLKDGGRINTVHLWLAGVDRPMHVIAGAKATLRREAQTVHSAIGQMRDAAGAQHRVIEWHVA